MTGLFVAWRSGDAKNGTWGPIGRLEFNGHLYRFVYTRGAQTLPGFHPLAGMEDIRQAYESETLFPVFANRLLPPSRPEYDAYLRWGGFDPNNPPDPIAILGVTEGIRQTDAVEVFPSPLPDMEGCYLNKFFVHGVGWMPAPVIDRIDRLQADDPLFLMLDPCNSADHNAVGVRTDSERTLIGYVPRYLAHDVGRLLRDCDPESIRLHVDRVNRDAPLQHRVLCRMRACWPDDFRPCSDEAFLPLPTALSESPSVWQRMKGALPW